jgi:hypothetical protein
LTARRFPPPWSIDELEACFVVIDSAGQTLAYVYFEEEPGRRSAGLKTCQFFRPACAFRRQAKSAINRQAAHQRRGAANSGERRQAAGAGALADFRVPIFCYGATADNEL